MPAPRLRDHLARVDSLVAKCLAEFAERHDRQQRAEYHYPYQSQEFVEVLNTGRGMSPDAWRERHVRHRHKVQKYMRFGVVTNGETVPIGGLPPTDVEQLPKDHEYFELRRRIQDLNRMVSRSVEVSAESGQVHYLQKDPVIRIRCRQELALRQVDGLGSSAAE